MSVHALFKQAATSSSHSSVLSANFSSAHADKLVHDQILGKGSVLIKFLVYVPKYANVNEKLLRDLWTVCTFKSSLVVVG